jgi:protein gp37
LIGETFYAIDWQIVTKRPERIDEVMCQDTLNWGFFEACRAWLLTSTEDQEQANKRIPEILKVPAAVHGISAEPLLGPINLKSIRWETGGSGGPAYVDVVDGTFCTMGGYGLAGPKLDWVIAGGESGPGARPMHPDWARSLRDQCQAAGVPFFFKQWGEFLPDNQNPAMIQTPPPPASGAIRVGKKAAGALLDGVEWKQFPEATR